MACIGSSNPDVAVTLTVEPSASSSEDVSPDQVIITPPPEPTATPGPLVELVDVVADSTGSGRRS